MPSALQLFAQTEALMKVKTEEEVAARVDRRRDDREKLEQLVPHKVVRRKQAEQLDYVS